MPGAVVLKLAMTYEDAREIERRAEQKMLAAPRRWPTRTAAILSEIGLASTTHLVPDGTQTITVEPKRSDEIPHVLPALILEADVVAGGPSAARRRALHEAYLEELLDEDAEEEDEEWEDEDEDEKTSGNDDSGP